MFKDVRFYPILNLAILGPLSLAFLPQCQEPWRWWRRKRARERRTKENEENNTQKKIQDNQKEQRKTLGAGQQYSQCFWQKYGLCLARRPSVQVSRQASRCPGVQVFMTFWKVKSVTRRGAKMAKIQCGVKPDIFEITAPSSPRLSRRSNRNVLHCTPTWCPTVTTTSSRPSTMTSM